METRATEQNILKYLQVLRDLKLILDNTSRLSMYEFSKKNKVTKSLSTVLQKGGVIKLTSKGRYTQWEWTSIEPNRSMAIKTLQELAKFNKPRKKQIKKIKGISVEPKKQKEKVIDYYEIKMFFGLVTFKIKPHFTIKKN